ncbi:hypothetical protein HOV93_50490 [Planctomycetes bacterium FF15]|uniref:Uncharacterized protein n=1 Tax=Bremerella alba TaxID=980252 RepID=A0A7V8VAA0_9BACT|nr:hypothetical protein [Bremerella alba]
MQSQRLTGTGTSRNDPDALAGLSQITHHGAIAVMET